MLFIWFCPTLGNSKEVLQFCVKERRRAPVVMLTGVRIFVLAKGLNCGNPICSADFTGNERQFCSEKVHEKRRRKRLTSCPKTTSRVPESSADQRLIRRFPRKSCVTSLGWTSFDCQAMLVRLRKVDRNIRKKASVACRQKIQFTRSAYCWYILFRSSHLFTLYCLVLSLLECCVSAEIWNCGYNKLEIFSLEMQQTRWFIGLQPRRGVWKKWFRGDAYFLSVTWHRIRVRFKVWTKNFGFRPASSHAEALFYGPTLNKSLAVSQQFQRCFQVDLTLRSTWLNFECDYPLRTVVMASFHKKTPLNAKPQEDFSHDRRPALFSWGFIHVEIVWIFTYRLTPKISEIMLKVSLSCSSPRSSERLLCLVGWIGKATFF